jgi:hypothetical protein
VVLAATSLEVFISQVLEALAPKAEPASALWTWINNRGDWQKEPSVEEQFSSLLGIATGHSLKEDNTLWEAFRHLRTARNSFAHRGVAEVGGKTLSPAAALALIAKADQIVERVREWLPEHERWPIFNVAANVTLTKAILGGTKEDTTTSEGGGAASQETPSK